jgi:tripartite motif-containing protein 71
VQAARTRRLVGIVTVIALLTIAAAIGGFELPLPHLGGTASSQPGPPGVRAVSASLVARVGAGSPPGGQLAFLAVEPSGNLFVSDAKRQTLLRFDPGGQLLSEWGPRLGDFVLGEPAGVAVARDSFYVVDRGTTPRVFRLDDRGSVRAVIDLTSLGTYGLNGLAVDANGSIFVADTGRNRLLVFSPDGQLLKQVGHGGNDIGGFTQPMNLALAPDGGFFVADWENARIERLDSTLQASDAWSVGFRPYGVAVDQLGRVFVPDADRHRLEAYSDRGGELGEIGAPGSAPTIDIAPRQVAVGRAGQLFVYVLGADGIQRLDLQNTPPPPPAAGASVDIVSLAAIGAMLAVVALAVISRRQ